MYKLYIPTYEEVNSRGITAQKDTYLDTDEIMRVSDGIQDLPAFCIMQFYCMKDTA